MVGEWIPAFAGMTDCGVLKTNWYKVAGAVGPVREVSHPMEAAARALITLVLSPGPSGAAYDATLVPASVMVLMYPKDGEYCILLNKRTHTVEHHKGEVSFPGGRKDEGDKTLLDTALRETHEEMGVRPQDVEVLGRLNDTPTSTGFLIAPFIGTIPYPYDFSPSDEEVAEVLEVPVRELMDESSRRDEVRIVDGALVNAPAYAHRGHLIHGATGRLLEQIVQRVSSAPGKEVLWTKA